MEAAIFYVLVYIGSLKNIYMKYVNTYLRNYTSDLFCQHINHGRVMVVAELI